MPISANTYSQTQWKLALIKEAAPGTQVVASMQLINVKDKPTIGRGAFRDQSVKSGDGRTAKKGDAITQEEGEEKTVSFTALVGKTELDILLANLTGNTINDTAGEDGTFEIGSNYTGGENGDIAVGSDSYTDNTGTLTAALISPESSSSEIIPGCIVRELSISGDSGSDGGLIEVSVTLVSWHKINDGQSAPTGMSAYTAGSSVFSVFDLKGMAGLTNIDGNNVVMAGFELTLNNNVKAFGFDTDGNPEVLSRGVPEITADGTFNVKLDANTAALVPKSKDQTSDIVIEMINNADLQTATFGFKANYGWISGDFDVGAVEEGAFIDVPFKFLGTGSSALFAFTTLDNS